MKRNPIIDVIPVHLKERIQEIGTLSQLAAVLGQRASPTPAALFSFPRFQFSF
jgi:hypothetical protein